MHDGARGVVVDEPLEVDRLATPRVWEAPGTWLQAQWLELGQEAQTSPSGVKSAFLGYAPVIVDPHRTQVDAGKRRARSQLSRRVPYELAQLRSRTEVCVSPAVVRACQRVADVLGCCDANCRAVWGTNARCAVGECYVPRRQHVRPGVASCIV